MSRTCPLCQLSPREGDVMRPIRISTEEEQKATKAPELGLYSACEECQSLKRKAVQERLAKEALQSSINGE